MDRQAAEFQRREQEIGAEFERREQEIAAEFERMKQERLARQKAHDLQWKQKMH